MSIKELLQKMLRMYFVLVTCILAAIMFIGMIFAPEARLEYKNLAAPFVYAIFGIVPMAVMYSPTELSDKQLIIRKIIQLLLTETEIMAFFILNSAIDTTRPETVIGLMISILAVFAVSNLISFINSFFTARKMTGELLDLRKKAGQEN